MSQGELRFAGWVGILFVIIWLPIMWFSMVEGLLCPIQNGSLRVVVIFLLPGASVYLLWSLKRFLNRHLLDRGSDIQIMVLIWLVIIFPLLILLKVSYVGEGYVILFRPLDFFLTPVFILGIAITILAMGLGRTNRDAQLQLKGFRRISLIIGVCAMISYLSFWSGVLAKSLGYSDTWVYITAFAETSLSLLMGVLIPINYAILGKVFLRAAKERDKTEPADSALPSA